MSQARFIRLKRATSLDWGSGWVGREVVVHEAFKYFDQPGGELDGSISRSMGQSAVCSVFGDSWGLMGLAILAPL